MKSVWEKCTAYGIRVDFHDIPLIVPRRGDKWVMRELKLWFTANELALINRVRLHQEVLFVSNVLGASGKTLDPKYMERRKGHEHWSKLSFPKEKPSNTDFKLWRVALRQLIPIGGI
jgi:hypothetical protein